jgi:hypothetical protein
VTTIPFRSEAFARGARMLRTALGPSIARYLEDPSIVEVMLNPDGRLWIDRLSGDWKTQGAASRPPTRSASSGSSPITSASKSMRHRPACQVNCPKAASGSKGSFPRSPWRRASQSAARQSLCSRSTTTSRPGSWAARRRRSLYLLFAAPGL